VSQPQASPTPPNLQVHVGVSPFVWRPAHAPTGLWWLLVLWVSLRRPGRRWGLVWLGLLAVGYRATLHMHFDKGYLLLLTAAGRTNLDLRYGETYPALFSWGDALFGSSVGTAHGVQWVLATVTAATLTRLAAAWGDSAARARLTGAVLCLWPAWHYAAGTETRFLLAGLLLVQVLLGLRSPTLSTRALAGFALFLLPGVRPLMAPAAALLTLWAAGRRRWAIAGLGVLGLLDRVLTLSWTDQSLRAAGGHDLLRWGAWSAFAEGLFELPWWLPHLAAPFCLVGVLVATARHRRLALGLLALFGVLTLPYVAQWRSADLLRFTLPSVPLLAWAFTAGLTAIASRWPKLPVYSLTALACAAAYPALPHFAWQAEYALLREGLPQLPNDAPVAYTSHLDPNGHMASWSHYIDGGTLQREAPPGSARFVGLSDTLQGDRGGCAEGGLFRTAGQDLGDMEAYGPFSDAAQQRTLCLIRSATDAHDDGGPGGTP